MFYTAKTAAVPGTTAACTLTACGGLQHSCCCAFSGHCCLRRRCLRSPHRSSYCPFAAALMALIPASWVLWPMDLRRAPTLRQPACPYGQSLRAITTVTISADFTSRTSFALAVANIDRQLIADAVATRILRRSAPRGPPSSSPFISHQCRVPHSRSCFARCRIPQI